MSFFEGLRATNRELRAVLAAPKFTMRSLILFFSALSLISIFSVSAQEVTDRNVGFVAPFPDLGEKAHVAFMGGSITEMNGYRPLVCEMLRKRFPETEFTFTAAGISSTCSMTGAFRLDRDVLSKGPVDLFFVEFAVNDDQDAHHDEKTAIRGMEGIVRHLKNEQGKTPIVMTFFANEHLMDEYRKGNEATSIRAHRKVAEHYGIPTIDVAGEVQRQIDEKKLTWEQFGGVHPAPYGNRLAANMIEILFEKAWNDAGKPGIPAKYVVPEPLDPFNYENGRFLSPDGAKFDDSWTWSVPDWKSIPGGFRDTFSGQKLLCADGPEAELTLKFEGKAIGAFILAGPDAGIVEYRIDEKTPGRKVLFHDYSRGLHYPRTVTFDDELEPGEHTLRLKLLDTVPPGSKGTAARILQFTVN